VSAGNAARTAKMRRVIWVVYDIDMGGLHSSSVLAWG
jgi:hypothetical protein